MRVSSLVYGQSTVFMNTDLISLKRRLQWRRKHSNIKLPRITGRYVANMFCVEETELALEQEGHYKQEGHWKHAKQKLSGSSSTFSSSSTYSSSSTSTTAASLLREPLYVVTYDEGDERHYKVSCAHTVLTPQTDGVELDVGVRVSNEKLGAGLITAIADHAHVEALHQAPGKKSGFTSEFRDLAIGMSLFPIDLISKVSSQPSPLLA